MPKLIKTNLSSIFHSKQKYKKYQIEKRETAQVVYAVATKKETNRQTKQQQNTGGKKIKGLFWR